MTGMTDKQILLLINYLIYEDYTTGMLLAHALAGKDVAKMEWEEQEPWLQKLTDLTQSARDLKMMPPAKKGTVRLFHSVLQMGGASVQEKIVEILTEGLSVSKSRQYKSQFGSFAGIWSQTDKPYNTNVLWFAYDVPESEFPPYDLRDIKDSRRTQPYQFIFGEDVPPDMITVAQGLPASRVRQAIARI